eukprot:TRINITY_DN6406_c0_g1_i2.p1 TRINITY_DN6406_c0_g1~~TRINITY_DN6406_c0_g1_i2.p1  ORF type:complete len:225 (+),score=35.30 TRINITY_DN6406_c0_g1_i2:385-1059(+)
MMVYNGESLRKIKILVLGDKDVGKTSFLHLLCKKRVLLNPSWTIGCDVQLMLHNHNNEDFIVEFWDVGGASRHCFSRPVFYDNLDGMLLVHDLSNNKSYNNLKRWIREIATHITNEADFSWTNSNDIDEGIMELSYPDGSLPVLIVGTKLDKSNLSYLQDGGVNQIYVNNLDEMTFSENSYELNSIKGFLSKTIENTHESTHQKAQYITRINSRKRNLRNLLEQ